MKKGVWFVFSPASISFCNILIQDVATPLLVRPVEVTYSTKTAVIWTEDGYICDEMGSVRGWGQ